MLKNYIETNLVNGFIKLENYSLRKHIFLVGKYDASL